MLMKTDYLGSPHIGIFCIMNDNISFVPRKCPKNFESLLKEELNVDVIKTSAAKTDLFGIFCVLNNKRMIVPDILEEEELEVFKDNLPEVLVLEEKYTALGNLIAMNDNGIVCFGGFKNLGQVLEKAVSVKVAGSDLVGSSLFVTNSGFLAHPDSSERELKKIEKALKVEGGLGTVNFGDSYVKSGIVGNKTGILTGFLTSGPELNRMDEIFILK